jgi:hypothetical protein
MQERARVVADKIGGTSAPLRVGRLPLWPPEFFSKGNSGPNVRYAFSLSGPGRLNLPGLSFPDHLDKLKEALIRWLFSTVRGSGWPRLNVMSMPLISSLEWWPSATADGTE